MQRCILESDILSYLQAREGRVPRSIIHTPGFEFHRRLHTSGAGDVKGLHRPVQSRFVETWQKVDSLLSALLAMVTDGLVEAHATGVLKNASTSARVTSRCLFAAGLPGTPGLRYYAFFRGLLLPRSLLLPCPLQAC